MPVRLDWSDVPPEPSAEQFLAVFFRPEFVSEVRGGYDHYIFPTLRAAMRAFKHRRVPEAEAAASKKGKAVRI